MKRFIRDLRAVAPSLHLGAMIVLLAASALVFAASDTSQVGVADVRLARQTEAVIASNALLKSSVREAILVGHSLTWGVVTEDQFEATIEAVRDMTDHFRSQADVLLASTTHLAEPENLVESADAVEAAALEVLKHLEGREIEPASGAAVEVLVPASETLTDQVVTLRNARDGHLAVVQRDLSRVSSAVRFVVAFLVPSLVLLLIFRTMRRRQRASFLQGEIARERELHKKKNSFLAAASHQINTPLASVVGYSQILRDNRKDLSAGVRNQMVDILAEQALETAHVVDDILIAGRSDFGELVAIEEQVNVREVVEEAILGLGTSLRARTTVSGHAMANTDPRWTTHIVRNLARNAGSFGRENIWVTVTRGHRNVVIEVSDDGDGLDTVPSEAMFNAYFDYRQVDGIAPTMGLGLSVTRLLARAMGGDVTYSRLDGISTFSVAIPAALENDEYRPIPPDLTIDPLEGYPSREAVARVVADGGPTIVFQPIVEVDPDHRKEPRVVGYEALSRFAFGNPADWFDSAEKAGLELEFELLCIRNAVAAFPADQVDGFLALNVSDGTLMSSQLLEALEGLDRSRVVLELSETALIKSYEKTTEVLNVLLAQGIRLAVDDVGSTEVDLWHVLRLEPSIIKLDTSLVRNLGGSLHHRALIRGLLELGDELGAMVICEGVETDLEAAMVCKLGVRYIQGNRFGAPGPLRWASRVLNRDTA